MKILFIILFSVGCYNYVASQDSIEKSDLRIKVDSIIEFQIGYIIDSTTNVVPKFEPDTVHFKGIQCYSTLPSNPMTVIQLDKIPIDVEVLNEYNLSAVEIVGVYGKDDELAGGLYGHLGKNGLIILETRE